MLIRELLFVAISAMKSSSAPSGEAAERDRIMYALQQCGWRAGADGAAVLLGMRRTTLQSRMHRLKIERQYK